MAIRFRQLVQTIIICSKLMIPISSKAMGGITGSLEQASQGIKILFQNKDLVFSWKPGNVPVVEGGKVHRAAGPDIITWSKSQYDDPIKVFSQLESPFSGIFVISKSASTTALLDSNLKFIQSSFVAIVSGEMLTNNIQKTLPQGISAIENIQIESSSTYGKLSLINVKTTFLVSSSTICEMLRELGYPVIGTIPNKPMPPFLALTSIIFPPGIINNGDEIGHKVSVDIPKKYLKFLKREALHHQRSSLNNSLTPTDNEPTDSLSFNTQTSFSTASFRGLSYKVPFDGLVPRESSGVLVDTAIECIRQLATLDETGNRRLISTSNSHDFFPRTASAFISANTNAFSLMSIPVPVTSDNSERMASSSVPAPQPRPRTKRPCSVLDLGCGAGTLLLAILSELSEVTGTGIDINEQALVFAEMNALAILGKKSIENEADNNHRYKFLKLNFGDLISLTKLSSMQSQASNNVDGIYDAIVCNPPYLSEAAARSRVTPEARTALVSGATGMEAYETICQSIIHCEKMKNRILKPGGWLIFQTPGGEHGEADVAKVLNNNNFNILGTRFDGRGIKRCIISTRL